MPLFSHCITLGIVVAVIIIGLAESSDKKESSKEDLNCDGIYKKDNTCQSTR